MELRGGTLICLLMLTLTVAPNASATQEVARTQHSCEEIGQRHRAIAETLDGSILHPLLFDASASGCVDLIATVLNQGAAIGARDRFGNTALLIAAMMGKRHTVGLLLERGSDIEHKNLVGSTALLRAAAMSRTETAHVLLNRGADPDAVNSRDLAPLSVAAYRGNERLVALLLDAGARPDNLIQTKRGPRGPMVYAARRGHSGTVAKLLDAGLDVNTRYKDASTALMLAAGHGNDVSLTAGLETTLLLLDRGASVDLINDHGRSALMIAAKRNHLEIVTLLLEKGANPLLMDFGGMSALEMTQDDQVLDVLGQALKTAKPVTSQ